MDARPGAFAPTSPAVRGDLFGGGEVTGGRERERVAAFGCARSIRAFCCARASIGPSLTPISFTICSCSGVRAGAGRKVAFAAGMVVAGAAAPTTAC